MDLPQKDREVLETILKGSADNLNDFQVAFLRARRDYLNTEQRRVFASVLGEVPPAPRTPEAPQQPTHFEKPAGDPGNTLPEAETEMPAQPETQGQSEVETPAEDAGGESEQAEQPASATEEVPEGEIANPEVDGATLPQTEDPEEENEFGASGSEDPDAQQQ
ncbi:MAG: hypothetical protein KGI08_03265 [Thaumarchaeota archaeon]|nr:hypothetical protein [Nitrososphaerota archaeon]